MALGTQQPPLEEAQRPPEAPGRQDGLGPARLELSPAVSLASVSLAEQQSHTTGKDSRLNPFLGWDQGAGWEVAALLHLSSSLVTKLLPSYSIKETGT